MALNLLKNLQSIVDGDVSARRGEDWENEEEEERRGRGEEEEEEEEGRAGGSEGNSHARERDETPRFEIRERLASAAARAMARLHVRAGCLCYIDDGAAACLGKLGGLKMLVAALGAYHCGRLSDRENIHENDGRLLEDVIFLEHQQTKTSSAEANRSSAIATANSGEPCAKDIVILCTGMLCTRLYDDIEHVINTHCRRQKNVTSLILRVHVLSNVPEEVYARVPSSELGEAAYSEFRSMLLRHKHGDDKISVQLDVSYFPLPMRLMSDTVFTLPSDVGRSLGGKGAFSKGLPPADADQELDDDDALTPEGIVIEAAALSALGSELGVKLEPFALGPASRAIGRIITDMPPTPLSMMSMKGASGAAALVLVDRTLDVATPCCHSDSIFDRLQHAGSVLRASGNAEVPSTDDARVSTSLYSIDMNDEDSRLWASFLTSPARDAMLELRAALRKALHAENISTQSAARSRSSVHALAAEVKDLANELSQHSTACCYRHRSLLAVANAAVHGIEETGEVWDAFSNAEVVLGMSGASEGDDAVSQQLEEYISKVHFCSGSDGTSMKRRANVDMSLEEILSLTIIAYVFAGELSKKERPMNMRSERQMKAALVDALERCTAAQLARTEDDGALGADEGTPAACWLSEIELAAETVATESLRRDAAHMPSTSVSAADAHGDDAWGDFDDFDNGGGGGTPPPPPTAASRKTAPMPAFVANAENAMASSGWDDEWGHDEGVEPSSSGDADDWGRGWDDDDDAENEKGDDVKAPTKSGNDNAAAQGAPSDGTALVADVTADGFLASGSKDPSESRTLTETNQDVRTHMPPTQSDANATPVNETALEGSAPPSSPSVDTSLASSNDDVIIEAAKDDSSPSSTKAKRPLVSSRVTRKPMASKLISSRSSSSKLTKPKLVTRVGGGTSKLTDVKRLTPSALKGRSTSSNTMTTDAIDDEDRSTMMTGTPAQQNLSEAPSPLPPPPSSTPALSKSDDKPEAPSHISTSASGKNAPTALETSTLSSSDESSAGPSSVLQAKKDTRSAHADTVKAGHVVEKPATMSTTQHTAPPPLPPSSSSSAAAAVTGAASMDVKSTEQISDRKKVASFRTSSHGASHTKESTTTTNASVDNTDANSRARRDLERRVDLVFKSLNDISRARRHARISKDRRMQMLQGIAGDDDEDAMSFFSGNQGHQSVARRVASCIAQGLEVESLTHSSGLMSGLLSGGLRAAGNIFGVGVGQGLIQGKRHPHDYNHVILYFVGGVAPGDIRDSYEELGARGFAGIEKKHEKISLFVGGSSILEQDRMTRDLLDWSGHSV